MRARRITTDMVPHGLNSNWHTGHVNCVIYGVITYDGCYVLSDGGR